jgi:hypothetical protein
MLVRVVSPLVPDSVLQPVQEAAAPTVVCSRNEAGEPMIRLRRASGIDGARGERATRIAKVARRRLQRSEVS